MKHVHSEHTCGERACFSWRRRFATGCESATVEGVCAGRRRRDTRRDSRRGCFRQTFRPDRLPPFIAGLTTIITDKREHFQSFNAFHMVLEEFSLFSTRIVIFCSLLFAHFSMNIPVLNFKFQISD